MAGVGMGGGMLGGGFALGSSFAVGDAAAQGLGIAIGMQNKYNPYQTIFAGVTSFGFGSYAGYVDPALSVFSSGFRSLLPAQVTVNRLGHEAAVDDFMARAAKNGFDVLGEGEVSVRTPFGLRKYDTALRSQSTGGVSGIEIKSTPGAMSRWDAAARQQSAADRWVNLYGSQVIGVNEGIGTISSTCRVFWAAPADPVGAGSWVYTTLGSMGSVTRGKDQ
jgi:hypothetical protein